jgi:transcriptional regulator with XRE-family HTH domain
MPSQDEKRAFSERLRQALQRSPKKVSTANDLALNFNLRHKSGDPITTQAAQKWLTGQAFPTIDKIATLAEWLNVSLQWLRFGIAEDRPTTSVRKPAKSKSGATAATADELKLIEILRSMPEERRDLIVGIIHQFGLDQEMWRE